MSKYCCYNFAQPYPAVVMQYSFHCEIMGYIIWNICTYIGATVLRGVTADVFLTGEMSHHEVLDATSRGTSVILCEHSNTERGYLTVMKHKLQQVLGNDIKISISDVDRDPLVIV